jgi:hypothetical protein
MVVVMILSVVVVVVVRTRLEGNRDVDSGINTIGRCIGTFHVVVTVKDETDRNSRKQCNATTRNLFETSIGSVHDRIILFLKKGPARGGCGCRRVIFSS